MAQIDRHAPGTFCWVELETTNQDAAKSFYGSLFGWSFTDSPIGPSAFYTIFQLGGHAAAAAYTQQEGERAKDVPPHWNLYIAVEDADASAARAVALGGTLAAPPFDVMTAGRMAVVTDPTGATFFLWQPKDNHGLGVMGENNSYVWADLSTGDRMAAKEFYEALFGWKIFPGKEKDESTYLHITSGERGIAGILPDTHRNTQAPPHWSPYFMVADADATTAKAQEWGAKVYVPPMNVDKSLRLAVLADPQGAVFSLFQS